MFQLHKNSNSKKMKEFDMNLTTMELRVQKDLMELKKFRMTTKMFNTQFSNVIKDYEQENLKMFVSMEMHSTRAKYNFCVIFPKDYPFEPPTIKTVNLNCSNLFFNSLPLMNSNTNENNLACKLVLKENWSPILSINTILFALELMLIDPNQEENINPINLFECERKLKIDTQSMLINDLPEFTNSPKIVNQTQIQHNFNSNNPFYTRRKRLSKEIGEINYSEMGNGKFTQESFKKFKFTSENIPTRTCNLFDLRELEENFSRVI